MWRFTIYILFLLILACNSNSDNKDIHVFYYQYEEFEKNRITSLLLENIMAEYSKNDYVINSNEVMQAVDRSAKISVDTLEKFHPYIHRIETFSDTKKYNIGDVKLIIRCISGADDWPSGFNFSRLAYTSEGKWMLQYDIGTHGLQGYPVEAAKRTNFIAQEIARASFK